MPYYLYFLSRESAYSEHPPSNPFIVELTDLPEPATPAQIGAAVRQRLADLRVGTRYHGHTVVAQLTVLQTVPAIDGDALLAHHHHDREAAERREQQQQLRKEIREREQALKRLGEP
jgi:hypothetical protein